MKLDHNITRLSVGLVFLMLLTLTGCARVPQGVSPSDSAVSPNQASSADTVVTPDPDGQRVDIDLGELPPSVHRIGESPNVYSLSDVSQHDSKNDCWIAIRGVVYEVTDFIRSHPGGNAILEGCGTDATTLYETRPMGSQTPHSSSARSMLDEYEIGELL